jgi:glycerol-3-phosphate dehydrogenase
MKRRRDLERLLAGGPYDLAIIGGGAAGAATLRAAVLRGLNAVLVERGDYAGGISSRSSRLIHGGLRYLEHGHWRLVRESLAERSILLAAAPHLVAPIRMHLPVYRGGRRSPAVLRLGLGLYDLLAGRSRLESSAILGPDALPGLAPDGLLAIGALTDARATAPERIVIETLIDAERQGGIAVNHLACERIHVVADRFELTLRDGAAAGTQTIAARAVVNAGGPWAAAVEALTGTAAPHRLRFVRGSHLVLSPFPGAPPSALLVEARRDGRPFFLLPWGEVIGVGTTEVEVADPGDPAATVASAAEIDYLLAELQAVWPAARGVAPLATLAGLRPLPADRTTIAASSRRHEIARVGTVSLPFFTILGGKLTTHRREGEEAARAVARALGRGDAGSKEPTRDRALPGMQCDPGPTFDARALAARAVIGEDAARSLLGRWGCRAWAVAAGMTGEEPIAGAGDLYPAEIRFALAHEGALGLDDVLCRRTQVWQSPALTAAGLEAAALVWASAGDAVAVPGDANGNRAAAEAARVRTLLRARYQRLL